MTNAILMLEKKSDMLRRLANYVLKTPNVKLAHVMEAIKAHGHIFDPDMTVVLTLLASHKELHGSVSTALANFASAIKEVGFKLPQFDRRAKLLQTRGLAGDSGATDFGVGGATQSMDAALRRILDHVGELEVDEDSNIIPLFNAMVAQIKNVESHAGSNYNFKPSTARESKENSEYLDRRYDELATRINQQVGSADNSDHITAYHLVNRGSRGAGKHHFAISRLEYIRFLEHAESAMPKGQKLNTLLYHAAVNDLYTDEAEKEALEEIADTVHVPATKNLSPPSTVVMPNNMNSKARSLWPTMWDEYDNITPKDMSVEEQWSRCEQVYEMLCKKEGLEPYNTQFVKVMVLSETDLSDMLPQMDLLEPETKVGNNIYEATFESRSPFRFSGFVSFRPDYRMDILWAIAPSDDQTNSNGDTYKKMLADMLNSNKVEMHTATGLELDVVITKTGAAYSSHKPVSYGFLNAKMLKLCAQIDSINENLMRAEVATGISRQHNETVSDDELPAQHSKSISK